MNNNIQKDNVQPASRLVGIFNSRKIIFAGLLLSVICLVSGCGRQAVTENEKPAPVNVKGQSAASSLSVIREVSYPGMVVAESEATISAKANGNLTGWKAKVGDIVSLGQELAKIDDVNSSNFNPSSFNTNQIKQAKLAVQQAESSYNLARDSYNNLLVSSVKDLQQAEIARDQASKNQSNLETTSAESLKSAELSYETAKIATEQARLSLANQEKLTTKNSSDARTNAELSAGSVVSTAGSILTNINNILAFDDNNATSISYRANLGATDASAYERTKTNYQAAISAYNEYQDKKFANVEERVDEALKVAEKTKALADSAKNLLDKTITSASLPQTSLAGVSLTSLQASVAGYQSQANAALSQINGTKQGLDSLDLNNGTLLDSLKKAYELAKQQEASAQQALTNLKTGNSSQQDQAGFALSLAQNQFDNLKVKIETQVAAAKSQLESAKIQYDNAAYTLQSLYDAHSVIVPLSGTITKIFATEGESIVQGAPIATVSQTGNIKIQFYVEADSLPYIKSGAAATVIGSDNTMHSGVVSAVSPQADTATRRFLVEVELAEPDGLLLGTVVTVKLKLVDSVSGPGLYILPLSAITVGQDGSYIYIASNGQAEKVSVDIQEVVGELARIKADINPEAIIIIEGNKSVQSGTAILVQ